MATINVNERSKFSVSFTFLSGATPSPPTTARWRMYCDTSETDITDWIVLSVPSTGVVTVDIPASYMRNLSGAATETKIISVEADYDTENQVSEEQVIIVKNLKKTS